jgi:hypothetical protein
MLQNLTHISSQTGADLHRLLVPRSHGGDEHQGGIGALSNRASFLPFFWCFVALISVSHSLLTLNLHPCKWPLHPYPCIITQVRLLRADGFDSIGEAVGANVLPKAPKPQVAGPKLALEPNPAS